MRVSLSLPSKPSSSSPNPPTTFDDSNANQNDDASIQYVNEFDASKPPATDHKPRVIPPIPNEWLQKKPESENRAEVDSLSANISSGLNLRPKPETESGGSDERLRSSAGADAEALAIRKLKEDLERLPEHRGKEEYDDVPVEEFGPALLAGYGWSPGRGIGKNAVNDVGVVEYRNRTADRRGLGFHLAA